MSDPLLAYDVDFPSYFWTYTTVPQEEGKTYRFKVIDCPTDATHWAYAKGCLKEYKKWKKQQKKKAQSFAKNHYRILTSR